MLGIKLLGYHYWYQMIEKIIPGQVVQQVVKKVIIDQLVAAPMVFFLLFSNI